MASPGAACARPQRLGFRPPVQRPPAVVVLAEPAQPVAAARARTAEGAGAADQLLAATGTRLLFLACKAQHHAHKAAAVAALGACAQSALLRSQLEGAPLAVRVAESNRLVAEVERYLRVVMRMSSASDQASHHHDAPAE